MLYFYLPYLSENFTLNNYLKLYVKYKDMSHIFNFDFRIIGQYGNFPYSFFSGDINTCLGDNNVVLYDAARNYCDGTAVVVIDFSNIFIEEKDLCDAKVKMVLDIFSERGNFISISNPEIKKLIEKEYKGYRFILSENLNLYSEIPIEGIDSLFEIFEVEKIELPSNYALSNLEKIKNIKNKNKIIIVLQNECSNCSYEVYKNCKIIEHNNQINFSKKSCIESCSEKIYPTDIFNQMEYFKKLGFSNFKISPMFSYDMERFNRFLLDFFIKKEYQQMFMDEYFAERGQLWK